MRRVLLGVVALVVCAAGCQKDSEKNPGKVSKVDTPKGSGAGTGSGSMRGPGGKPQVPQVKAPFDVKTPPKDAVKTASGLVYKKITTVPDGPTPGKNDAVRVHYTGWKQSGETVYTTTGRGQPMPMSLAQIPPGFSEAMQLMKKGEKAMLWIPPEIGYGAAKPPNPEPMAYEVELVEIESAPPVPTDLGKPPATAKKTKGGVPYVVVKPGTGKEKAQPHDNVTFNLTAWDAGGNMVETTELGPRKRAVTQPPFRQPKGLEEALTTLVAGERGRFWLEKDKMQLRQPPKVDGLLTVEVEVLEIKKQPPPPATPKDVAKPPATAKKTEKGVFYKVLKKGKGGAKPKGTDTVTCNYTGWTTDGRMFDSSVTRGQPAEFPLNGVIAGWTDGLQQMQVGDTFRFWIPEELAYQGKPGKPAGMLVFDVELISIKGPPPPPPAAPSDVAAPPKDAKKSPKGVFYKVLTQGKPGGKQPTAADVVRVHYTGWTTDGKMFDSSVSRGQPAEFPLSGVIPGWTDGLQQMKVGDKFRFWIPVELAYNNAPGKPAGMLVFDVELLDVKAQP